MYKRVLVAYNATRNSTIALREAFDIVRSCGGELHVLGIVSNVGALAVAETAGASDLLGLERQRIKDALEDVANRLEKHGVKSTTSIQEGEPAHQILATAHRIGADLAVVGHSNKGVLARWFQGSVGAKLLSELPCSLLIATERPQA